MDKLLKDIKQSIGCVYLSDLHYCVDKQRILDLLAPTMKNYSLEEWYDACSYLFIHDKRIEKFNSYEELRDYLQDKK